MVSHGCPWPIYIGLLHAAHTLSGGNWHWCGCNFRLWHINRSQTDCFKRLRDWSDTIPGVECGHGAVGSLDDRANRVGGKEGCEESIIELPLFAGNRKLYIVPVTVSLERTST